MVGRVTGIFLVGVSCLLVSWIPFSDPQRSVLPGLLGVEQTWAFSFPHAVQAVPSVPLRGIVSLQCDDGALNNLALAESLAVRHVPCAFAVVTSSVNSGHPAYMNSFDLLHLVSLGHSVLDHSTSHNPQIGLMSDTDKDAEIRNSRNSLRSWGLDPKVWVAPGGPGYANWWVLLKETVARYYPFAMMENGWNNANPAIGIDSVDAYRIGSYSPYPDLGWSTASVRTELAKRLGRNEWVVLKFHTTPDSIVTKILNVVDWLVANDVAIVSEEDEAALWFYGQFDLPQNIFVDNAFTRDIDSDGRPDNCAYTDPMNYFVTDGRFGSDPLGGARYLVVKSNECQFLLSGVSRGGTYTTSFWAKALSPNGALVRCRTYQEKHGSVAAASSGYSEIFFSLPDTSWHMLDSTVVSGCNFVANDSTELLRLRFTSYSVTDSGVCIARPSVQLTSGGSPGPPESQGLRCWPSPAKESLSLRYFLPQAADVHLFIFDILGRAVSLLETGYRAAGPHVSVWDTRDDNGRKVAPGVYFCRLESASLRQTRKVVVLR